MRLALALLSGVDVALWFGNAAERLPAFHTPISIAGALAILGAWSALDRLPR